MPALTGTNGLPEADRGRLRETGLVVVQGDGELAQTLAVRVSSTFLIVGQEGGIRWVHEGVVDQEVLRRAVLAVVSEGRTDE